MVTMPSRGSLICISIAAETICRIRTASLRARAGSAMRTSWIRASGDAGGCSWAPASEVVVGDELPVRRQQRHLRPFGQQPLAGVEDVGHLTHLPGDGG